MGLEELKIERGLVDFGSFSLEIPDLRISEGIYWLQGPNGSGKTTFLRLLLGFQHLTIGNISNNCQIIGYVPQGYREIVFPWLSAKDNLCLFPDNIDFAIEWAEKLGLKQNELNRRSHQLSGGQAQRLSLIHI